MSSVRVGPCAPTASVTGDRAGEVLVQSLPDGDALHPRRGVAMTPAPLGGKPLPPDAPADRRQFFADWLTSANNPYFAKAVVNRVWRNFMGRGLVEPEDDLPRRHLETLLERRRLVAQRRVPERDGREGERCKCNEGKCPLHRCGTPAYCEKWPKIAALSRSQKSMTAVVTNTVAKPVAAVSERGRMACAIGKIEPAIIVQPSVW